MCPSLKKFSYSLNVKYFFEKISKYSLNKCYNNRITPVLVLSRSLSQRIPDIQPIAPRNINNYNRKLRRISLVTSSTLEIKEDEPILEDNSNTEKIYNCAHIPKSDRVNFLLLHILIC